MDEEELVKGIEAVHGEPEPPDTLSARVHRSVLVASVVQAIVRLYVSAVALVGASLLDLLGGDDRENPPGQGEGKE